MKQIRSRSGHLLYEHPVDAEEPAELVRAALTLKLPLADVYLRNADLSELSFRGLDLSTAIFDGVRLTNACFADACLSAAGFLRCDLTGTNFRGALLAHSVFDSITAASQATDFTCAMLHGAEIGAEIDAESAEIFTRAKCTGWELAVARATRVPAEGPFIGWKACADGRIVKLRIPARAKRSSALGLKCRCSEAKVLSISDAQDPKIRYEKAVSWATVTGYKPVTYVVGETVKPHNGWNPDRWRECASGIHFFMTREEAVSMIS